ncbi:hypothetical protein C8R44DRAFT_747302 [Mycena epipterygia]|nr:hypothetical protein C8R44DRAFT_747302 [Mycena epipterygia]
MPPLHRWRGNACKSRDFGAIWPWILYPWDFEEADRFCGLAPGLVDLYQKSMPPLPVILAQFGHGYHIRGTLKRLMGVLAWLKVWGIRTRNPLRCCLAREEMPAKVMILAQFAHGYYIRGTLKRLTDVFDHRYYIRETLKRLTNVVASLKAWWIRFEHGYYIRGNLKRLTDVVAWLTAFWIWIRNPWHCCLAGEEMPTKVMILAQFEHGYYIRGTLKRLTDVLAWLKAWWICVGVKQVTDLKSMPLLPRWSGNACKSCDFGSVWPWILYPWDLEEADRCCGLAPGLVDLLTNSKAVFCAFSLKMSEEKS